MRVRHSARSHVGQRREINQDAYGTDEIDGITLIVVCDGMGGHTAGEVASRIGVDTILSTVRTEDTAPSGDRLRDAFKAANQQIYNEGRGSMGTTGVAALFIDNALVVANVGDSRAYLIREGTITQISKDHSFVSEQIDAGMMTAEQARHSNVRNIITRALGYQSSVETDIYRHPLQTGDTVVLSSDGMHGLIEDDEIAELASMLPLEEATQRLVDLANERGGTDNITVIIAQVDQLDPAPPATTDTTEPVEIHAATTDQLPTVAPDTPTEPQPTIPVDTTPTEPAAPAPPTPEKPQELRLSRIGALLSLLTVLVLIGGGLLALNAGSGGGIEPIATAEAPSEIVPTIGTVAPPEPTRATPLATPTLPKPTPSITDNSNSSSTEATPAP
jgi:serine/threonine protein phosphatase PrpC